MDNGKSNIVNHKSIAILHYAGPPLIGGVEVTMAAHAKVLAVDGWHVRMIAGSGGAVGPDVELILNPLLGSRGPQIEQVNRELAQGTVSHAYDTLVAQIYTVLREALAGVDVLMVHNVISLHKNLACTAALAQLQRAGDGPKLLAWCHDFAWLDPLYTPELHPGEPWDLLRTVWPNTQYVVVSQDRRAMLAGLLGLPEGAVAVVTPGFDLAAFLKLEPETVALIEQFDLLTAAPLLLLPARITRRKNIEAAIAIVGGLRAEGLRPKLVITGPPGPHNPTNAAYLAQLQALRDATGDPASVVFLYEVFRDEADAPRPVSDAMLSDFYRIADGLLFPSRYEGFGIPILEAALVGMPMFASDIPPFRETAGAAALLFDLDAPAEATAARIADQLRNDQRGALRRRVRQTYSWEAIYRREIVPLL